MNPRSYCFSLFLSFISQVHILFSADEVRFQSATYLSDEKIVIYVSDDRAEQGCHFLTFNLQSKKIEAVWPAPIDIRSGQLTCDNEKLFFLRASTNGTSSICRTQLNQEKIETLLSSDGSITALSIAPGGETIYYARSTRTRTSSQGRQLFTSYLIYCLETISRQENLIFQDDLRAVLSIRTLGNSGKLLVHLERRRDPDSRLVTIDKDRNIEKELSCDQDVWTAETGRNGQRVAYSSMGNGPPYSITTLDLLKNVKSNIPGCPSVSSLNGFSPDNLRVLFISTLKLEGNKEQEEFKNRQPFAQKYPHIGFLYELNLASNTFNELLRSTSLTNLIRPTENSN